MNKLHIVTISSMLFLISCGSTETARITENDVEVSRNIQEGRIEYIPIDPVSVNTVEYYHIDKDTLFVSYWRALDDSLKRVLLPIQSAEVSLRKLNYGGSVDYLGSSLSGDRGLYSVVMDYMKYRIEPIENSSSTNNTEAPNDSLMLTDKSIVMNDDSFIGNAKVGVGLRIKANVETFEANLNLSSLTSLGVQANANKLSGSISVDVIGIDSKDVTNLIPLTSEIDQTSIQSALQALASIKTKIHDPETIITPHIVAITNTTQESKDEAVQKFTEEKREDNSN